MSAANKKKLEVVDDSVEPEDDGPASMDAPEPDPEPEIAMVKLPFRGTDFELPKLMDEWDTEACLAMNDGNYISASKMLLGPQQWAKLMALGSKRKDIREFLTVFSDVVDKECIA